MQVRQVLSLERERDQGIDRLIKHIVSSYRWGRRGAGRETRLVRICGRNEWVSSSSLRVFRFVGVDNSSARMRNQELKHIMGSYGTVLRDRTIHIDLLSSF